MRVVPARPQVETGPYASDEPADHWLGRTLRSVRADLDDATDCSQVRTATRNHRLTDIF